MNFRLVGNLKGIKDTEKFKAYTDATSASGWRYPRYHFNVVCGDNRHMLQINAGFWADEHGDIYSFTKDTVNEDGSRTKGESIKIPFKDRLNAKWLEKVAGFKIFTVDLEQPGRRSKLVKLADALKEGSVTDADLKEVGLTSEDEIADALDKSNAKKHEFISEWDFLQFVKKVIDSGKYDAKKFVVIGDATYSYNESKGQVYTNYVPRKFYLAADDEPYSSVATMKFYFNKDSLNDDDEKATVIGYQREYNDGAKKDDPNRIIGVETAITIAKDNTDDAEKDEKRFKAIKRKFSCDDDIWYEYNIEVEMIDGAQKQAISEDDLTDEQKDDLELGIITMDDIRAELGGSVYGERIREFRFLKPARGSTKGREPSDYTTEDFNFKVASEDDDDDLFDL